MIGVNLLDMIKLSKGRDSCKEQWLIPQIDPCTLCSFICTLFQVGREGPVYGMILSSYFRDRRLNVRWTCTTIAKLS